MFAADPAARERAHAHARGGPFSGLVRQTVPVVNRHHDPQLPIAARRDRQSTVHTAASPAEAAAIVAALEQFMRETAPRLGATPASSDPWARAAILEAVGHEDDAPSVWGDPLPWS